MEAELTSMRQEKDKVEAELGRYKKLPVTQVDTEHGRALGSFDGAHRRSLSMPHSQANVRASHF